MPRPKKKPPEEWTSEEALERLFPKRVRDRVKKEVEAPSKPQVNPPKRAIKKKDS
jgi:hypothetical protein